MKKKWRILLAAVICTAMAAGCSSPSGGNSGTQITQSGTEQKAEEETVESKGDEAAAQEEQEPVTLKLSTTTTPGTVFVDSFHELADTVNQKTGGKVTIEVYDSSQLGAEQDVLANVIDGVIDMIGTVGTGVLTEYAPEFGVFDTPYLFESYEDFEKFQQSDTAAAFEKRAGDKVGDVVVTGMINMGVRSYMEDKRPVVTPEDLKGLKIRTPQQETIMSTVEAMGAVPTPMAPTELYLSIQQGVVDGAEHAPSGQKAFNVQEVCKYYIKTEHARQVVFAVISQNALDKLTPENQKILLDTWKEIEVSCSRACEEEDGKIIEEFEKDNGVEIIEPDKAAFEEVLQPVIEKLKLSDPEVYEAIKGN